MSISRYLCRIVGEQPEYAQKLHESSQRRLKAFAISIHIPVVVWAVTSYMVAAGVFDLRGEISAAIAMCCSLLVYLVERLVLLTPKTWFINVGRLLIGVVISILGASAVDMVIFDKEVALVLRAAGEARIARGFDERLQTQRQEVETRKADWMRAQETASCEANGTCGTMARNVGPVYQELARQAERLRGDYDSALIKSDKLEQDRDYALSEWRTSRRAIQEAGLLSRVEALHQYTMANTAALVAWLLFFVLVLCMELMVVLVKLVFGETVDDQLMQIREDLSAYRARSYFEATISPYTHAHDLIHSAP